MDRVGHLEGVNDTTHRGRREEEVFSCPDKFPSRPLEPQGVFSIIRPQAFAAEDEDTYGKKYR